MFNSKARYALRAMSQLAERAPRPATSAQLARRIGASTKFTEAILTRLAQHGLLDSQRGRTGGYRLAQPASEIDLWRVIAATYAWPPAPACSAYNRACDGCEDIAACPIRAAFEDADLALRHALASRTLDQLAAAPAPSESKDDES